MKVYKTEDVRETDPLDLWRKALLRVKLQTYEGGPHWHSLKDFITAADEIFTDDPQFIPNKTKK